MDLLQISQSILEILPAIGALLLVALMGMGCILSAVLATIYAIDTIIQLARGRKNR